MQQLSSISNSSRHSKRIMSTGHKAQIPQDSLLIKHIINLNLR